MKKTVKGFITADGDVSIFRKKKSEVVKTLKSRGWTDAGLEMMHSLRVVSCTITYSLPPPTRGR